MTREEIESFITQFPIYQYAFIQTEDITFSDKVRTICKKECPRYGTSWSCPPAVGTVEKCEQRCREYPQALFFSSVADVKNGASFKEILDTQREHEKMTQIIENYLKDQALLVYTLSTESCSVCEKCTYPRGGCLHPELMHPCIESHGIVVHHLIEQNLMDYYLGENLILWFSIIFYRDSGPVEGA